MDHLFFVFFATLISAAFAVQIDVVIPGVKNQKIRSDLCDLISDFIERKQIFLQLEDVFFNENLYHINGAS